jgi:hypothetical protein
MKYLVGYEQDGSTLWWETSPQGRGNRSQPAGMLPETMGLIFGIVTMSVVLEEGGLVWYVWVGLKKVEIEKKMEYEC